MIKSTLQAFVIAFVVALAALWSSAGFATNIGPLLDSCPQNDPAYGQIRSDFDLRRNGIPVGNITCTEPVSSMPLEQYTDQLIALQSLRTIRYMDSCIHLPWTSLTLYDWMRLKIGGIDISDTSGGYSYCCEYFGGRPYFVWGAQDDFNRDFDRGWRGIASDIDLFTHETRHVDGFPHPSCCPFEGSCDQTYDEANLSPVGLQWWLNAHWLTGELYVGFSCLDPAQVQEAANWHLSGCNQTYGIEFCDTRPPILAMALSPGGECRDCLPGSDTDADGEPNCCDNCLFVPNTDQADQDHDRSGDACDCAPADPAVAGCQCIGRSSGLVGWWPGDGNANDISGNGNSGTLTNGATATATGKVLQAFSSPGYVALPPSPLLNFTFGATVEAWIRPANVNGFGREIMRSRTDWSGNPPYWLYLDGSSLVEQFVDREPPNVFGPYFLRSPSGILAANTWAHVAMTFQSGALKLYVNGTLAASTSTPNNYLFDPSRPLYGGQPQIGNGFSGLIDEVKVHDRALGASEIQAIYAAGGNGICKCFDADGDGYGSVGGLSCARGVLQDCNDADSGVWSPPVEVTHLRHLPFATGLSLLTWEDQAPAVGPGVVYDVLAGDLETLPVGSGAEFCAHSMLQQATLPEGSLPGAGRGFWYLVRGRNPCGIGTYGRQSNGTPEVSSTCP